MKEYGVEASWTKLISLLNPEDSGYCRSGYYHQPLCASEDNTITLIRNAKELIRINEKWEILEKTHFSNDSGKFGGIAFVESLISAEFSGAEREEISDDMSTTDYDSA